MTRSNREFGAAVWMLTVGLSMTAFPAWSADFYRDKTISIIVGSTTGGSYDAYARLLSRHMGRHIPGAPTIVVRNMPGAAGIQATRYVAEVASKDGTFMSATNNTVPMTQVLDPTKISFDCAELQWIGTAASPANVLVTWHAAKIKSLGDAQKREVTIGATTAGGTMEVYPLLANNLFGTNFKVVMGYLGGTDVNLAMERGEVEGRGSNSYLSYKFQNPEWIRDGKLDVLFQMTLKRDPLLPNVPALIEFAKNDEQHQIVSLQATSEEIGRPLVAAAETPADRVAILRKALLDAVQDPALRADAEKAQLELQPVSGEEMQALIASIVHTNLAIVKKYKQAISR